MKPVGELRIVVLGLMVLSATAFAKSPREELRQMVEQLQKTPGDNALRERIIKLAATIKPPPAIPEAAREPFVMGATVLKKATDTAGAVKAVDLFTQAIHIAPWYAEAYRSRALARETAGQFEAAIDDLTLYLGFKLSDGERRTVQDKIYSLKADAQLAAAKQVELDKISRAEELKRQAEQATRDAQQAKRDVITSVKNAVNDRNYQQKNIGYNSASWDGGANQYELFGGGTYYVFNFDFYIPIYWKFFDERVELWGRLDTGQQEIILRGESSGPKVTDMRWFQVNTLTLESSKQIWAYFDLQNGHLYSTLNGWAMRPIAESDFDPNKRYNYVVYRPMK